MGTFKKGILGGFSGKVGNVIGSSWKGISYMRSIPQKVNNPQTPKQEAHRKKFKLILDYLKPLSSILELGFQDYTQRQTGLNAALSHNIKNAISGTSPNWQINKHELLIARGTLTPIERIHFQRLGQLIIINWINNTGAGNASANDKAIAIMYNTTRKEIKAITAGPERAYQTCVLQIPQGWENCHIDIYCTFITEDQKQISNSKYIGTTQL